MYLLNLMKLAGYSPHQKFESPSFVRSKTRYLNLIKECDTIHRFFYGQKGIMISSTPLYFNPQQRVKYKDDLYRFFLIFVTTFYYNAFFP